jgi:hypothetical protein
MAQADNANTTSPPPGARPAATVSPTGTDPIYAAIAAHKAAERAHGDAITLTDTLEKELPKDLRRSNIDAQEEDIVETDDLRWIAAERAKWAAIEKECECADALLEVRPTTLTGLMSLLRHADEGDAGRDWPDCVASVAAEALEQIMGADATAAEAVEALPPGGPVEEADPRVSRFGKACHEWFEARATEAKLNAGGHADADDPDAAIDVVLERLQAAEHQLTCLPAILPHQLVDKFEILETMICQRERNGRPADNRHMLMLTSVKADLYRFRMLT